MAAFLDVCRFSPSAGGTTDWTFASAVTGYQSPAAAGVVNGRLYKYRAESADLSQWEIGEGAYNTSSGVLARTTVLFNSSGTTAKINFATTPQVAVVALKEDLISVEESNGFTAAQKSQARSNIDAQQTISSFSAILGADVAMSVANTLFDAVSLSLGTSGTFLIVGTMSLKDTSAAAKFLARLTDGTNIYAYSGWVYSTGAGNAVQVTLAAIATNPAGPIRMQGFNATSANGKIVYNDAGAGRDTQLVAIKVG